MARIITSSKELENSLFISVGDTVIFPGFTNNRFTPSLDFRYMIGLERPYLNIWAAFKVSKEDMSRVCQILYDDPTHEWSYAYTELESPWPVQWQSLSYNHLRYNLTRMVYFTYLLIQCNKVGIRMVTLDNLPTHIVDIALDETLKKFPSINSQVPTIPESEEIVDNIPEYKPHFNSLNL